MVAFVVRSTPRRQRGKQRELELSAKSEEVADSRRSSDPFAVDPANLAMTRQLTGLILERIFLAFEAELPRLKKRDHDILCRRYRLEPHFSPKAPAVQFPSAAAARAFSPGCTKQ